MIKDNLKFFNDNSNVDEYDFIDNFLLNTDRNKIFFDSSPLAIVIINEKGIFLDANRKLYDWLGYRSAEVIGKSFVEVPFIHNDSKKILIDNFYKRIRGENVPPYEVEFIHKNGMKKYGEIYGNLLHDDDRGVTLDIVMVSDITEKKKEFENLKYIQETYRILFDNTYDLVQIVNAEGKFVDVNPVWLETLEYSKEEVNNLMLVDILQKDQTKHYLELFNKAAQGENIKNIETVFISKTKKEIYVQGNIKGYFKDYVFIATVGIFKNISKK